MYLRLFAIVTLGWIAVSAAMADPLLYTPPTSRPAGVSEGDRRHAYELARESIASIERNDLDGAERSLRDALLILPQKAIWHYNLACIQSVRGQSDAAIDSLGRACAMGFTDFTRLEREASFARLHDLARWKDLLARKDQICHDAATHAVESLKARFGPGYLYDVDEERKLIFATNTDRATLEALRNSLVAQTKSQQQELFPNASDEFILIVVPTLNDYHKLIRRIGVIGYYDDQTRTLVAQRLGQVMTHEFTHALHAADQRALGQEHPVWLREGLASMYESAEPDENGRLIPTDNFRLGFVQSAARRHALIPIDKLLATSLDDFVRSPNLAYGQSSSILLYLYEQKLLRKFYDEYKATYQADPSGQGALEAVSGQSLTEFEKSWEKWMLARQPPKLSQHGVSLGAHFANVVDGVKLSLVVPLGPAARAGLQSGDLVVGIDGRDVRDFASLAPLLSSHAAGDEVKLRIRRGADYRDVSVTLE